MGVSSATERPAANVRGYNMTNDGKRPKHEDSIANLSRRDFLIASALVGTGVGLSACEDKPKPQARLSPPPGDDVDQAQPCLKTRPDGDVVEPAQSRLKVRPEKDVVEPESGLSVSLEDFDATDADVRCLSTLLSPAEVDLDAVDGLAVDALAAPHPCLSHPPSPLDEPTVCLSVARPKNPTQRIN